MKVLFKTDEWHSRNSREFIGVFNNEVRVEEIIENYNLRENDLEYFEIVEVEMNEEI